MLAECLLGGSYFTKSFIYSLTETREAKESVHCEVPGSLQKPQVSFNPTSESPLRKYCNH